MKHPVFEDGRVLLEAVIVAEDGAGADVDAFADLAVAEVGEVVGLAAPAEAGLLRLDEVADVAAWLRVTLSGRRWVKGPTCAPSPDAALERPRCRASGRRPAVDRRRRSARSPRRCARPRPIAVVPRSCTLGSRTASGATSTPDVDVRGLQVAHRHAALRERARDPLAQRCFAFGELRAVVDAPRVFEVPGEPEHRPGRSPARRCR